MHDIIEKLETDQPPNWLQVTQELIRHCPAPIQACLGPYFKAALQWDDKLFFTDDWNYVSTKKFNKDFMTYSERFESAYAAGGYILDEFKRVRAGPTTKTVDFGLLMDILKSKDEKLLEENAWIFDRDANFLDLSSATTVESTGNIVTYCSFPRSGNSFLRMYLQKVTGIATGADMTLELGTDLQVVSFKGEEIIDSSVWIKKSHEPYTTFNNIVCKSNKVIMCVRNPYDSISSMMHFFSTLI